MSNSKLWMLGILLALFVFSSCKKDEEETPQVNESEVLASFLESTNSPYMKDYVNTDMPSIISAVDVNTLNLTDQIYIIDIRSATDYATGHIENAVNVAATEVLNHIESNDLSGYEKIAIVCYTGQTAGWATSLCRLIGHNNVFSMKWGMSSWNPFFASKWQNSIGNAYATQFTGDATDKNAAGSLPTLSTGKTTGLDILNSRIATVFAEGFDPAKVTAQAVFDNLNNYYIVNYWPEAQYADPGHIPGAIQYTPKETIKLAVDLKTLPTDKTIAVYCYTGQTSAFLTAYLRLLGYDAKSILFGANGMIYDIMLDAGMTTFKDSEVNEFDYVQ
ncbi:MAG: rhodanese-like domain-containing protein [Bacteroidales bacterium]|nr:rhodanese-like domain-containing protein [Bacteroidales bacterium]